MHVFDRVHGELHLPPLVAELCATPAVARLDSVRQLGVCAFVYPSATHTRREHSLGVSHLCGTAARLLQQSLPIGVVSDDDVLCLYVAGLLHDAGHGPLSHFFEHFAADSFCHEAMSVEVVARVLTPDRVARHFATPQHDHVRFVQLLIVGLDADAPWPLTDRSEETRFLVDVLHSRSSGLDLDKMDYLVRDAAACLGLQNALCVTRLLAGMRASEDRRHIVFDERLSFEVGDIARLRAKLHRQVYQHRRVLLIEALLTRELQALRASLSEAASTLDGLLELTDASVLPLSWIPTLHEYVRAPTTLELRTKPYCGGCGATTSVTDAWCGSCGRSTHDRPAVVVNGLCETPESGLTAEGLTRRVASGSGVALDRVVVVVSDIHCGVGLALKDPHGRRWRQHDPRLGVPCRTPSSLLFPEATRVRTAHCYYRGPRCRHIEAAFEKCLVVV